MIQIPGLINLDFADVKTIMTEQGEALMGIGVATGENRAIDAAKAAISSPLLDVSIDGARGILFTVTASSSLGMQEVSEAAKVITNSADEDAKVIFGTVIDDSMKDDLRITVVATGFDDERISRKIDREKEEETRPFMNSTRNFYSTVPSVEKNTFQDKNIKEEEEKEVEITPRRTGFTAKKVFSFSNSSINNRDQKGQSPQVETVKTPFHSPKSTNKIDDNKNKKEDDDLEIPAFIRRKMGM